MRPIEGICLLCLGLSFLAGCEHKSAAMPTLPPTKVTVAKPIEREVTDFEELTGRTAAVESVDIRSRVTGYLVKIAFEDGDDVKRAQLLFEIDPRPFKAEYDKALAQIKVAEADLRYRKADVDRNKPLLAKGVVAQSDFDKMVAALDEAAATVKANEAAAETAALNLSFCRILSPIAGKVSRKNITYGNLVSADSTLLTNVVSVDPIYAYFNADELTHLRVQQAAREGKLKLGKTAEIPVYMQIGGEQGYPHEGLINFADNRVDPSTGTLQLRAVFPNPKPEVGNRVLEPGLFAQIRVPIGKPHKALLITERAIGSDQGDKYVLTVNDKHEVEYHRVTLGKLENGLRVIEDGLTPADWVIVSGLQRVRPGATVEEKPTEMTNYARQATSKGDAPNPQSPAADASQTSTQAPVTSDQPARPDARDK